MSDTNVDVVKVQITAEVGQLVAGMKQAGGVVRTSAEDMRASMLAVGTGAAEAKKGHEGLLNSLREFKSEAVSTGRTARYFSTQLAEIIPGAEGSTHALRALISIGLGGFGIVAGVELAVLALAQLKQVWEENEKQAKELEKAYSATFKTVTEAMKKVAESFDPKTKAEMAWEEQVHGVRKEMDKLDEKINDIKRHAGGVRDVLSNWLGVVGVSSTDKLIASLQAQKTALVAGLVTAHPSKEMAVEEEAAQTAYAEMSKLAEKNAHDLAAIDVARIAEIKKRNDAVMAETTKWLEWQTKHELEARKLAAEGGKKIEDENEKHREERMKRLDAFQTAQFQSEAKEAEAMGLKVGSVFAGMIDGTKTFGDVTKLVMHDVARVVMDLAVKEITAKALSAGAGAADSQAGVPFVGPILAIAAMSGMIASVMALIGHLPSAASGWDIPAGVNPILQAHGGEAIITAPTTERLSKALDAGGLGGGDIHLNFHGPVDFQWWQANQANILRTLEDAARRGRRW